MRLQLQDDDTALLEQALAMSMAEAAQAAASAGGGPAAADISMTESGGDDQDLAYGKTSCDFTSHRMVLLLIVIPTHQLVVIYLGLFFSFCLEG